MLNIDKPLAGLVVLWLWGFGMNSVLSWLERHLNPRPKPQGFSRKEKKVLKRLVEQLEKAHDDEDDWE